MSGLTKMQESRGRRSQDDRKVAVGDAATRRGAQGPVVGPSRDDDTVFTACMNHYEGCEAMLVVGEVADHEKGCTLRKERTCHFCDYRARSGSQLVAHVASSHPADLLRPGDVIKLPAAEQRRVLLRVDWLSLATVELEMVGDKRVTVRVRRLTKPQARTRHRQYRVCFRGESGRETFFAVVWKREERDGGGWLEHVAVDLERHFPGEPLDALFCGVDVGDGFDWNNLRSYVRRTLDSCKEKDARIEEMRKAHSGREESFQKLQTELCVQETQLKVTKRLLPRRDEAAFRSKYLVGRRTACRCVKCHVTVTSGPIFFDSEDTVLCPNCVFYAPVECLDSPYTCPCGDVFPIRKYHQHASCPSDRRYKCVASGCDCFLPLKELRKHWHAEEELRVGNRVELEDVQENVAFYWNIDKELIFCRLVCRSGEEIILFIKEIDMLPTFGKNIYLDIAESILPVKQEKETILFEQNLGYYIYKKSCKLSRCNITLRIE